MVEFIRRTYGRVLDVFGFIKKRLNIAYMIWYWECAIKSRVIGRSVLSAPQKTSAREYFSQWGIKIFLTSHSFYTEKTGEFHIDYIPDSIYYAYIDKYFNNWSLARAIDNKTYYRKMFPTIKQPEMVCYRCGSIWYSGMDSVISQDDAIELCRKQGGVFVKQATLSEGGAGVKFVENGRCGAITIEELFKRLQGDIVVQKKLEQSHILNKLNKSSVNTIRVLTLLNRQGKAKVYSSILRMGINGSKVDNASAGGITCGIKQDGTLKGVAYSNDGNRYFQHPTSGVKFDEITIPNFSGIKEAAIHLAPLLPHFRLVSWDFALNDSDEIVLIEANLCYGELDFHQLNNGPIFGSDQAQILDEVFGTINERYPA